MSRRKQARPRHLEDELDNTGSVKAELKDDIIENTRKPEVESPEIDVPCFPEVLGETEKLPSALSDDAHVCGKCRVEFFDLTEFHAHKQQCGKTRSLILFGDGQSSASDLRMSNGLNSQFGETESDNLEAASQDGGSDGEQNFENLATEEDDVTGEDEVTDYNDQLECDDYDEMNEDMKSMTGEDIEEGSYKDEELFDEKLKDDLSSQLPPYMLPLANILPGSTTNSNVLLEPLEATKAAVAQFAENNLPSTDVTVLHSTLYNLQQQQIMQLQLIQQLQQQLAQSQMQNGQMPSGLASAQLPLSSAITSSANDSSAKSSKSQVTSPDADSVVTDNKEQVTSVPATTLQSSESKSSSHMSSSSLSSSGASTQSSSSSASSSASSSTWTTPTSSHRSSHSSGGGGTSSLLDFSRSSKLLDQNQFVSDDPFFKHKCRLCHKVFGSDSALQIHIRSHTDLHCPKGPLIPGLSSIPTMSIPDIWTWEKPFKCNICGGRFSTRGNLKVHFQRHKAEFPDVEMNPNPVPEHLDKMPLLGSPFPPSSITPFASPSFMGMPGLMNGLLFPPPSLAPRPPSTSHLPNHLPPVKPHSLPDEKRSASPSSAMAAKTNSLPDEKRSSSPHSASSVQPKKEPSPTPSSKEAPPHSSPNVKDTAKIPLSMSSLHSMSMPLHLSQPSPMMPLSSMPLVSNYPVMSSLPSRPPFPPHKSSSMAPSSQQNGDPFRTSILPASVLDNDDNLEQFMEIDKSETSKLQQLVDNIEHKLTDPNQCVICHRVLSCKSALQMHYRIHTGERPFKCKICGRAFTTKGNLKTHMGVHRAKPPLRMMHQCPVCHKQFTNLLVLQQHIRSHTGISSLPSVPSLTNLNTYSRPDFDGHQHRPLNMTRPHPDSDKELDLRKKPRLDLDSGTDDKSNISEDHMEDELGTGDDNVDDEIDEELDELNNMDEEANSYAARVSKREDNDSPNSADGQSLSQEKSREEQDDSTQEGDKSDRPKSSQSTDEAVYKDLASRSLSPKYLQEAPSPLGNSQDGGYSKAYSTSLAALEERVRAIDSSMARNPLSQFHAAPFLLGPGTDGLVMNGERSSISPRSHPPSESGSEGNHKEDGIKPPTPALSCSSEGSGSNFMLGALDLRPHEGNGKTPTTCNICFKTFACRSALDIHYRSHTKERPFKCDLCDRAFTTRGNMKQHMLTHKIRDYPPGEDSSSERNNNNSCTPNQNDSSNPESSNESAHFEETQVKKEQTTPPEKAATSSSSPSSTVSSSTTSKTSSSNSSSSQDSSPFVQKSPVVKHQCMVCQKGFSSASALQIHIRTHTGDKPFKCTVCGKAFTTKGNLKVHMGTHMWNNSPSRRGRRMSIEPPFMLAHKDNPYMTPGFPPRPDLYPFQFPPFMNGFPTPPKSLNEISVIQGLNSGLGGPGSQGLKPELISPRGSDRMNGKSESPDSNEDRQKFATESGELDLSMKSTGSSGSRDSKTSPSSVDSGSSSQGMLSPTSQSASLGWGWKASCHLCNRSFPNHPALDHHMRTMHMMGESHKVAAS